MTAARTKDLRDLLDEATAQPSPTRPPTSPAPSRTRAGRASATSSAGGGRPRYLTYERKEARLTGEQSDALTQLTRALNRARRGEGERLTDNTLIRVAVDMLLAQSATLTGTTESALRKSVGL